MNEFSTKQTFSDQFSTSEGINEEDSIYKENSYKNTNKKQQQPNTIANTKSSLIKKPITTASSKRSKSRLSFTKPNGVIDSSFPALHQNIISNSPEKSEQLEYEVLPDFYNKNDDQLEDKKEIENSSNDEDISIDEISSSQNSQKQTSIPIESIAPSPIRSTFRDDLEQQRQESNEQIKTDFEKLIFDSLIKKESEEEEEARDEEEDEY